MNRELQPEVLVLDDRRCVELIEQASGAELALAFQREARGSFKADICRGAALWLHGGFYFDVDLEALLPLDAFVRPYTTFTTVQNDVATGVGFFQAFVGVTARHVVMQTYLRFLVQYYRGVRNVTAAGAGLLGVPLLYEAYHECCQREGAADGATLGRNPNVGHQILDSQDSQPGLVSWVQWEGVANSLLTRDRW